MQLQPTNQLGYQRRGKRNNRSRNRNQHTIRLKRAVYDAYEDMPPMRPLSQNRIRTEDVRYTTVLTASGATNQVQFRTSLVNLSRAANGTGTYSRAANFASEYDFFKITHIKYDWLPIATGATMQKFPMILIYDLDDPDTTNLNSYAEAIEYDTYVYRKNDEPWQYNVKIPQYTSLSDVGIVSTVPATIIAGGFIDLNNVNVTGGAIKLYAEAGTPANVGRLVITARVVYKMGR